MTFLLSIVAFCPPNSATPPAAMISGPLLEFGARDEHLLPGHPLGIVLPEGAVCADARACADARGQEMFSCTIAAPRKPGQDHSYIELAGKSGRPLGRLT